MLQRVAISVVILMTIILSLQLLPAAADGFDEAQAPPVDCPQMGIISDQIPGNQGQFSASVWTNTILTYKWTVANGTILSGETDATMVAQLSPAAAKKAKLAKKNPVLAVTLTLGNLPEGCPSSLTRDLEILPPLGG